MKNGRWPVWKLSQLRYPFAAAGVAINLVLQALMARAIGLPSLSPNTSLVGRVVLGIPAARPPGRWVRRLMDQADSKPGSRPGA